MVAAVRFGGAARRTRNSSASAWQHSHGIQGTGSELSRPVPEFSILGWTAEGGWPAVGSFDGHHVVEGQFIQEVRGDVHNAHATGSKSIARAPRRSVWEVESRRARSTGRPGPGRPHPLTILDGRAPDRPHRAARAPSRFPRTGHPRRPHRPHRGTWDTVARRDHSPSFCLERSVLGRPQYSQVQNSTAYNS